MSADPTPLAADLSLRRLLPEPGTLTPAEAASGLGLAELAPPDRPYLVLNMVATLDGKASLEGRTKGMGSDADRALFHHLRTQADAVMAGAGTLRTERYRRVVRDPELRVKREREGLASDPVACLVSASLAGLDDLPMLEAPEQRVVVLTAGDAQLAPAAATVDYVWAPALADSDAVDLPAAFGRLRADHGIRSILCEGGPALNAELLRAGLVDELFLCLAPRLVGGADALTIVGGHGLLPEPAELELVWLLERRGELFLRLRVRGHAGG